MLTNLDLFDIICDSNLRKTPNKDAINLLTEFLNGKNGKSCSK